MSSITDALLAGCFGGDEIEALNSELAKVREGPGWAFGVLDTRQAGGSKVFCTNLAAGALNYCFVDLLCAAMRRTKWREPDRLSLLLCHEQDERWSIIDWRAEGSR